jgi:TRAP transporter 4TM/12TM fusion protein
LIVYCLYGQYFPGDFGHRGFSLPKVVEYMYSLEGVFGVVCQTYANFIFLFILFGAFLTATKTGDFFIDLALSIVGRARGGAAKVAVLGSGLVGSIVGSGSANVAITSVFTIPLMKKTGFKPHMAGAVEAAASIGGHITPPVMGSVIFLLAALTNTSYVEVAVLSIIPAVLWYFSIYVAVHYNAVKYGIRGLPADKVPKFWPTLKKGWSFFLPVVTMVVTLGLRYSPHICAVASIFCMFIVAMFHKDTRFTLKSLIDTLYQGAAGSLVLGATAGTMGIILGGITFPGLAIKFSSLILSYSHNILPVALILIMIAAYILGMGMTVTPAYVVLAVLAAPALLELGVPVLVAHLSIVWFSQSSPLTPPFCLAAFVGAGIAKANPMKTGFASVRLAFVMYLVPFMMVYKPLLLNGPVMDVVLTVAGAFLGVAMVAVCLEGYFRRHMTVGERAAGLLAAGLLMFFGPLWQLLGLAVASALYFWQVKGGRGIMAAA